MRKIIARLTAAALLAGTVAVGGAGAASAHNWTYPPCPRSPYTEGATHHRLITYSVNRNTGSMQPWVTAQWLITKYGLNGQPTQHVHLVERRCNI